MVKVIFKQKYQIFNGCRLTDVRNFCSYLWNVTTLLHENAFYLWMTKKNNDWKTSIMKIGWSSQQTAVRGTWCYCCWTFYNIVRFYLTLMPSTGIKQPYLLSEYKWSLSFHVKTDWTSFLNLATQQIQIKLNSYSDWIPFELRFFGDTDFTST